MRYFLFVLTALSIIGASCTKTPSKPDPSMEDLLRTGKWRVSKSEVTLTGPNGVRTTVDYGMYRKKCIIDNYLRFDSASYGAVHNNGTSCSIADADSITFLWQLKNNNKNMDLYNFSLMIDSVGQNIVYDGTNNKYLWKLDSAITSRTNLVNAQIANFSKKSFQMIYSYPGVYLDTTAGRQASPAVKPDTYTFTITYSNY